MVVFGWSASLLLCALLEPHRGGRVHAPAAMAAAAIGSISLTAIILAGNAGYLTVAALTLLPLLFLCMVPDEPLVSVTSGITALLGVGMITAQGGFSDLEALVTCAVAAAVSLGSARLHRRERLTDQTALEEARARTISLESRWRHLIETSQDAILIVDISTDTVLGANRVAMDWMESEEWAGWRLSKMLREPEGSLLARCATRAPWSATGILISTPGGKTFPADLRIHPFADPQSLIVAVVLQDAAQRLLRSQQEAKTNRLTQVGAVAAGIIHEINNPLAFMIANLYYLEDVLLKPTSGSGGAPPEPGVLKEVIRDTRKGARRVQQIANHMLSLARKDESDHEPVDVGRVITLVVKMARAQLPEGSELHVEMGDPPPVMFSRTHLSQVLLNLMLNAAQAIQRGGGGDIYVRVWTRPPDRVAIEVRDTGPGMPYAVLTRVTEPFFTTREEGTGLGLSVCMSIVEEHDGRMTIDSVEGKGTVVRLELARVMEPSLLDRLMLSASDSSI